MMHPQTKELLQQLTDGMPPEHPCQCGMDIEKICPSCVEGRKLLYFREHNERAQSRSRLGPIRRYSRLAEPKVGARKQSARLDNARRELSIKLGRRVSKREFAEYLNAQSKKIYEQQVALKNAEGLGKTITVAVKCSECGHLEVEHQPDLGCWGKPEVINTDGPTPGCRCKSFKA